MDTWTGEHGLFVEIDQKKSLIALDKLGGELPNYSDLVAPTTSLTSEDIISVRAEHGLWHAIEYDDVNDDGEPVICEAGVVAVWESDGHPIIGYNPCAVAKLVLGYPGGDDRWNLPYTYEVACVYEPFVDPDTGEEREYADVMREVYGELVQVIGDL